jgi:hypothetical protein
VVRSFCFEKLAGRGGLQESRAHQVTLQKNTGLRGGKGGTAHLLFDGPQAQQDVGEFASLAGYDTIE